ncbi:MAG: M1 family metallopeptidase [Mucilaginibacter sp.]|jgi:aminopeptidase N|uniref:M1 family metallopeptidase n=1 Tax=Mucilaginibacter sp. TaxID=1882438 RepID=UPI0035636B57
MKKTTRTISAALCLLALGIGANAQTSGGKLKPEQAIMDVRHYTVALNMDFAKKSIDGSTVIDVIMAQPTKVLILDLMDSLHVSAVSVNGKKEAFNHKNGLITINTAKQLPAGKASIKVVYGGRPRIAKNPPWDDGFTWTQDSTGHPWLAVTAEGTGGKIFFPCKDHPSDEPNEGADMLITVPKDLVVAGPGILKGVSKKGTTATYHWQTKYSINNYSIVFNAGDYKVVTGSYKSVAGNIVPVQFYVLKYHTEQAPHFIELVIKAAQEKEKYFGEYPWAKEKLGIAETPHLGMEHQSMNAYGNKFRYTKVGGQDFDWLMYHEFGHEWWGNKVTARDWADYWIHEGIDTYADALPILDLEGKAAYIKHFKQSAFGIANKQPIVLGKDIDEESAYNNDIYTKGAYFMHTLHYVMGDTLFFATLKGLATDPKFTYDHQNVTDDVEQYFSKAYGKSLKPLFDFYLRTTNKLEVSVKAKPRDKYLITLLNIGTELPVDVTTDAGTKRMTLTPKGITVESKTTPIIDADGWYLKKVILE